MNDREYVLCALSVATRAIENAATALHKQEAREFGDTAQTKGSPKLPSNLAWKLVPVEPTDAMLDAMQTAGIAAFDADIDASLGDTPLDPTHARRAIWRAALDAAPEVPYHREAMRMALDALEQSRPLTSEDDFVLLVRQHQQAIIALRAALGESRE